jgi:hypothetical protein
MAPAAAMSRETTRRTHIATIIAMPSSARR